MWEQRAKGRGDVWDFPVTRSAEVPRRARVEAVRAQSKTQGSHADIDGMESYGMLPGRGSVVDGVTIVRKC